MKANEFVKQYGWDEASALVDASRLCGIDKSIVDIVELRKLVSSYDLVDACGGINVVKQHLKNGNVFRFEEKPLMKQAIADVESCQ